MAGGLLRSTYGAGSGLVCCSRISWRQAMYAIAVLPQFVYLTQQLDVSARNIEPVELVERRLKARDRLLGCLAGSNDKQPLVNVMLLAPEGLRFLLQLC